VTKIKKLSQLITAGIARSPNRAMLRAVGFKDGDFEKPIVGVANGHSTMNPCNASSRSLIALWQLSGKPAQCHRCLVFRQ
jgi:dihydroxyacid dehydratase/phosphogluconate dehydratase